MCLRRWIRLRRSDSNSSGWSRCPVFSVLLYQLHCLSWPDEYLIGICRFICMLYNFGLCNGNTGREAAAPTLPLTRTPSSAGGSLRCCSKEQRDGLIQGAGKGFSREAFPLFLSPSFSSSPLQISEFDLQHTGLETLQSNWGILPMSLRACEHSCNLAL